MSTPPIPARCGTVSRPCSARDRRAPARHSPSPHSPSAAARSPDRAAPTTTRSRVVSNFRPPHSSRPPRPLCPYRPRLPPRDRRAPAQHSPSPHSPMLPIPPILPILHTLHTFAPFTPCFRTLLLAAMPRRVRPCPRLPPRDRRAPALHSPFPQPKSLSREFLCIILFFLLFSGAKRL